MDEAPSVEKGETPDEKATALSAFTIVALLAIAALPARSEEIEETTISEYCAARNDLGLSHGACVAHLTTHNVVPHDARVCRDTSIQNRLDVSNHGPCMNKLKAVRK
jgi:gamma-glutamylcysteine synthetase